MGPDLITVVLEDLFTPAERTLIGADKFEQVRATRLAFQDQVEPLFRQAIEQLTGRTVRGFLSQVSEQNFGAEVFVLEPRESVNDA